MCGIFAIFSKNGEAIPPRIYRSRLQSIREIGYRQSAKQRHRGPDDTGVCEIKEHGVLMIHERLAVIGVETGHQPLYSKDDNVILIANGMIYNYCELAARIAEKRGHYQPKSDCNVIVELYEQHAEQLFSHITGMYAFILYDRQKKIILIARDPFGIVSLYIGEDEQGNILVASEMKCIEEFCIKLETFAPGEYRMGKADNLRRYKYFEPQWMKTIPNMPADLTMLRAKLMTAVESHLQCDVPFGALLSGGVDSSLCASIATKLRRKLDPNFRLQTFSVGLPNAPDFKAARLVADYIQSDHTEVVFELDEALDCLPELIYHLESYDVSTVRCSLPMLLLSRYVKSTGIKMVLSGEGADEIFGGYLYFFYAPNYTEFHEELVERLDQLNLSDCLRANKSTMAKGIELRVPFLDTEFVNYVMSIRPQDKIPGKNNCLNDVPEYRIEKHILRAAFANEFLPDEVLWRQKEQFSDGVGYEFIDTLKRVLSQRVSDEEFNMASGKFPVNTPSTKEAYYYRCLFAEMFPSKVAADTVTKWLPRLDWGCPEDPSGRAQQAHKAKNC